MAQMSGTRCEAFNWLLIPVAAAAGISLMVPMLPLAGELACLYMATAAVTAAHLHYAVCLLIQLCQMLDIRCFSISPSKVPGDSGVSSAKSEDRERLLSGQEDDLEIEVVVASRDSAARQEPTATA